MIKFNLLHPDMTEDHLGLIPFFLSEKDDRPAREQIDHHYQHGGGWRPINGFKLNAKFTKLDKTSSPFVMSRQLGVKYPGDPMLKPLAVARMMNLKRDETLVFYDGSFLAIFQPDFTFEIARLD